MKKSVLKIVLLSCLFCGCSNTDDKLHKHIESHCNFDMPDTCYINIKDALKIDCDKMYLFGETTTADEISKIIGIVYRNNKYISDSKYRMILLKDDKIVYEDDYYQRHTYFSGGDHIIGSLCYRLYTSSTFSVKRVEDSGRSPYHYILREKIE